MAACSKSLVKAFTLLNKDSAKRLDADLFLVKHLLILREQITPFNMDLKTKKQELDFSNTSLAFTEFLHKRRQIFALDRTNAVLGFMSQGVPTIHETEVDCKRNLDNQLRDMCDKFILHAYEVSSKFALKTYCAHHDLCRSVL